MICSANIPAVLNRICDEKSIHSALLVTTDGELMGVSSNSSKSVTDPEAIGTLLADVGVDYSRLGMDFAAVDAVQRHGSHLQCLLIELEMGLVGISSCYGLDCLVIAIAHVDTPPGMLKAKLQALVDHVHESFTPFTESTGA